MKEIKLIEEAVKKKIPPNRVLKKLKVNFKYDEQSAPVIQIELIVSKATY